MIAPLKKAKELLGNRKTLPVLSSTAQAILSEASNQFTDLKSFARCIESDAAISARIVGVANSSFYGQVNEITSVENAIIRVLGLDLARGIAVGMICSNSLGSPQAASFDPERFWKSSLTKSIISSTIASNSLSLAEQVPLCSLTGLLSNIGLLVAAVIVPNETQASIEAEGQCLGSQMNLRLKCDHRHFTAALAELWTLPNEIQNTFTTRCEFDWATDKVSRGLSPIQACMSLVDIIKTNDFEQISEMPQVSRLINILGIPQQLDFVSASLKKAEASISEVASVLARV